MPRGRALTRDIKSFSELPKVTKGGATKITLYLNADSIVLFDSLRESLGGEISPSLSDMIRYVAKNYMAQKAEIKRLQQELDKDLNSKSPFPMTGCLQCGSNHISFTRINKLISFSCCACGNQWGSPGTESTL